MEFTLCPSLNFYMLNENVISKKHTFHSISVLFGLNHVIYRSYLSQRYVEPFSYVELFFVEPHIGTISAIILIYTSLCAQSFAYFLYKHSSIFVVHNY